MNTVTKRSVIGLLGAVLTLVAGGVYYLVQGHMPMPSFFSLGFTFPYVIGFVFVNPRRGPEMDERDRLILQKGITIGLIVAFVGVFLAFEILAFGQGFDGQVAVRDVRYIFPLNMLVAVLVQHAYVWFANRGLAQ